MRSWPALDISGLEGDPDRVSAALDGLDVAAVEETTADRWRVHFHDAAARARAQDAVARECPGLAVSSIDVPDEDWAARSQASLTRVTIGRVIVAPPWDVPLVVTIQPSMGFGTGHHATTRLCLAALQTLDLTHRTVLDVGTGSAVLAIAASLLGAAESTGIDDDPDAVHAAWENLALNPAASVTLLVGDLRTTELSPADVVLANLTGGLLIATAARLRAVTTSAGGRLVLSGFRTDEEAGVMDAFAGLGVEHRDEEEGWVCVTLS